MVWEFVKGCLEGRGSESYGRLRPVASAGVTVLRRAGREERETSMKLE